MKNIMYVFLAMASLVSADDVVFTELLPTTFEYSALTYFNLEELSKSEEFQATWPQYEDQFPAYVKTVLPNCKEVMGAGFVITGKKLKQKIKETKKVINKKKQYVSINKGVGRLYFFRCSDPDELISKSLESGKFAENGHSDDFAVVFDVVERGKTGYLLFDKNSGAFVYSYSLKVIEQVQGVLQGEVSSIIEEGDHQVMEAIKYASSDADSNSSFRFYDGSVIKRGKLQGELEKENIDEAEYKKKLEEIEKDYSCFVRVYLFSNKSRTDQIYYKFGRSIGSGSSNKLKEFMKKQNLSGKVSESSGYVKIVTPKFELSKNKKLKEEKLKEQRKDK